MSAHEQTLVAIGDRVDRLLELCRTLQEENRSLRWGSPDEHDYHGELDVDFRKCR